jgi:hypothetical protein
VLQYPRLWEPDNAGALKFWAERLGRKTGAVSRASTKAEPKGGHDESCLYGLDFLGHDVGCAISATEEDVGFFVGDDLFGRGIEF